MRDLFPMTLRPGATIEPMDMPGGCAMINAPLPPRREREIALEDVFALIPLGQAPQYVADVLVAAYGPEFGRVVAECAVGLVK